MQTSSTEDNISLLPDAIVPVADQTYEESAELITDLADLRAHYDAMFPDISQTENLDQRRPSLARLLPLEGIMSESLMRARMLDNILKLDEAIVAECDEWAADAEMAEWSSRAEDASTSLRSILTQNETEILLIEIALLKKDNERLRT